MTTDEPTSTRSSLPSSDIFIPYYHSDFHSSLEINVNKANHILIIPHYHSDFHSSLEINVNKVNNITTETFFINIREQQPHIILILLFNIREKLIFNQYLTKTTSHLHLFVTSSVYLVDSFFWCVSIYLLEWLG